MTEQEKVNEYNAKHYSGMMTEDDNDVEFTFERDDFIDWINDRRGIHDRKKTEISKHVTIQRAATYFDTGRTFSIQNVKEFKQSWLDNGHSPAYINGILSALKNYARFLAEKYNAPALGSMPITHVHMQQKQFIDNVISRADYDFLVNESRKDLKHPNVYLGIRIMGTTGVRKSELYQVKVEHLKHGYIDVVGKGSKQRRIYFPKNARDEILQYLEQLGVNSGYVIRRWKSTVDSKCYTANTRGCGKIAEDLKFDRLFAQQLERAGERFGIAPELMHPHGFRHFFAKEFLKHHLDISLLADLLGHSSLEVTRIYLKMTSKEQADIVNEIVTW